VRRLAAWLLAAAATVALLEGAVAGGVALGLLHTPPPLRGGTGFWRGDHPDFGVWHEPNAEHVHRMRCFEATYRTNSVGARDVERPERAAEPRVVVLGDSFLEGWGVDADERVSNRLEQATGIPHLNFAMSHFGPYQELLVYRKLAKRFDHAGVVASVVPRNDFLDLTPERARHMANYAYRYRPYLVEGPGGFTHLDLQEPPWRRLLRRNSYAFNAALEAVRALTGASWRRADGPGPGPPSDYYDAPQAEQRVLDAVLVALAEEVGSRPLAVVVIPTLRDLERSRREGPSPLTRHLRALGEAHGFLVVDLLPDMARDPLAYTSYFHACDYHWSPFGNRAAARLLLEHLEEPFYGALD